MRERETEKGRKIKERGSKIRGEMARESERVRV
jgi:hypothetical protein